MHRCRPQLRWMGEGRDEIKGRESITGRDRAFLQAEKSAQFFSERKQTVTGIHYTGDQVEIDIDYQGTLAMDLPTGPKAGETIALKGRSVFTFQDNKIIHLMDISRSSW